MQEKQDAASIDTGLHSLVLMARFHQVAASPAQLLHVRGKGNRVFSPEDLLHAARGLSLRARLVKSTISRLGSTPLPVMVQRHDGRWLILARFEGGKCLVENMRVGNFFVGFPRCLVGSFCQGRRLPYRSCHFGGRDGENLCKGKA